jgi:acetylornithine/N-succinyldiaminopimelate aminotransferase
MMGYRLAADELHDDPVIQKAKEEIIASIQRYREKITAPKPPQSEFKIGYEEAVKQLSNLRGQDLFYPYIGSGFGNGALVELADGSVKYDFISGIGTHWGHAHPKLIEASLDASIQDTCMGSNLQYNRDAYELMSLLCKQTGLKHCFLATSGAIANENALKIIFQKKAPAYRVLAFEKCFMGRTLALSQITDRPQFRQGLPTNVFVDYVPFYDWRDPKGSTERALTILKSHLSRYPKAHACMCFELIQGEAGSYPGKQEFFLALIKILKENNVAVFIDEIQTFGRTDHLFAFQHFGIDEYVDVMTCGKLMHACVTMFTEEFKPQPLLVAQTFISAISSIRVATVIVKSLLEEGYLGTEGKNMRTRKHFVEHLQKLAEKYPHKLEGPYGYGLMIACTPFKGEKEKVTQFAKALFEDGVITYTAGVNPTRLRFLVPPGGVTLNDIDHAAMILDKTLNRISA